MMRSRNLSKKQRRFPSDQVLISNMGKTASNEEPKVCIIKSFKISSELSSVGRKETPSSFHAGWWFACQHYAIPIKDCIPPEVFKAPSAHDPGEPLHSKKFPEILIIKLIEEGFYVRSEKMRLQRHTVV